MKHFKNRTGFWVWAIGLIIGFAEVAARATGFDLPDQDPFAIGRGMAFVATADNPSAIYYNPAGLTQLSGSNLRAGVYGLYLDPSYKSPTTGETFHNEDKFHAVPQLWYAYTMETLPLSFGLGMFAPFGLSSKWPQDTGFRTVATEGTLSYYTINPVVAWKILPNLSVAAGLTINYADTDLQQGLFWPTQPYDNFRFKGNGWDVGFNLGVMYKPIEQISLGATFRSGTQVNLEGHTEFYNNTALPLPNGAVIPPFPTQQVGAQAEFNFPFKVIFGVSYRPSTNWNFEFDADYTDWNTVGQVTVKQATPFPPLLPQDVPINLNWQSSWYFELGATRYLGNGWLISAGYIYNQNSVPDANYNPLVADEDRQFLSLGVGHRGKRFDFDVAYQFGFAVNRTVTGSAPSAIGQSADGQYGFMSQALAASVTMHF